MHPTLCHSILMEKKTYPQNECTIYAIPIHHYTNTNMSHQNISIMHTSHHNISSWFCLDTDWKAIHLYTPSIVCITHTCTYKSHMGSTNTTPAPAYTHFDLQPIRAYPRHQPWHTFSQLSQYHHHEHELSTHYTHRTSIVNAPAISHVRRYNTIAIVSTDWYQYQQLPPPTPISSHAHRIQHSPHLLMNKDNYPYICLYRLKFNSSRIHRYASSAQRNIAHMHPHHIPHGALPLLLAPTPTIHSHLCIPCINLKLAIQYNTIVSTDWCWHQQLPPTDIFATSPGIINCNITTSGRLTLESKSWNTYTVSYEKYSYF